MRLVLVVLAGLAGGCVIGTETAMVGVWRPQRKVDTEVCIEEAPGRCTRTVQVARDLPARSFGGGTLGLFAPGYVHVANAAASRHRFALDTHYEYLRGRGPFALGVRVGGNLAIGSDAQAFTLPVTLVGHWGGPRLSFYAGAGFTPVGREWATVNDVRTSTNLYGLNVLGGARALLRPGRTNQLTTSLVLTHQALGDVSLTSVTAALGIDF